MNKAVKVSSFVLAIGAASMFALAPVSASANTHHTVKCSGINSCKGKSSCKSASNSCKGQNSCKGKGWIMTSKKHCDKKGGTVVQ